MELWNEKVAIVTGASSGIGAAVCKDLCKWNITVVGLARRLGRMNQLRVEITELHSKSRFHPIQCDLTKEENIQKAFAECAHKFGGVDILINNAGVACNKPVLEEGNEYDIQRIIQTNLVAVFSCTKKAYKSMVDRDAYGYIINISSILGHGVPISAPKIKPIRNAYPCTKFALTALNHVLRCELNFYNNTKIRISNISPGAVKTEIFEAAGISNDKYPDDMPWLLPADVSDAIMYVLGTPKRVQIQDIIIKPTGERF